MYPNWSESSRLAVEASGLTREFGENRAVDGVDLRIEPGTVHALIGPNGAGKTTIVRMLATLLRPTAGRVAVFGHDIGTEVRVVRQLISMTGQFASIDDDLTATENLILLARLWGHGRVAARKRADALIHTFDLADAAGRQASTFSGGMRRRLDIAASMVVAPRLMFLDEPTLGLDPRSRNDVWRMVRSMVDAGTTVVLTTQYLDEADSLADRITVIDHGRIVADDTATNLKARVGEQTLRIRLARRDDLAAALQMLRNIVGDAVDADADALALTVPVIEPGVAGAALTALAAADITVATASVAQPSLDEVFLSLTEAGTTSTRDDTKNGESA